MEKQIPSYLMKKYVQNSLREIPSKDGIPDLCEVRRIREECRSQEGGGGMCHFVTEILQDRMGLSRLPVSYLSEDGKVIVAGHLVSLLGDGTIFDPTADQFGEDEDIRIISPDDEAYARYRPEFTDEYNPNVDPQRLAGWGRWWSGDADCIDESVNKMNFGEGWWLENTSKLVEYYTDQIRYAEDRGASWSDCDIRFFSSCRANAEAAMQRSAGMMP